MCCNRKPKQAFTLVELLIVIGIIALLIAILLPALNRAHDSAVTIKCLSQLHQLALMNDMYCADNKNYLFPMYWAGSTAAGATSTDVTFILQRYMQNSNSLRTLSSTTESALNYRMWLCPAADHGQSTSQFPQTYGFNNGVHPKTGYDKNNVLYMWIAPGTVGPTNDPNWQYTMKKLTSFRRPSEVVQMADASLSSGAWTTTGELTYTGSNVQEMYDITKADLPIDQLGNWSWTPNADIGGTTYGMRYRHNGNKYGNVVFIDGHAASYQYNDKNHPNVGLKMKNFAYGY